jgi:hypothetical protein
VTGAAIVTTVVGVEATVHATTPRGDCHQSGSFTGKVVSAEKITQCPDLDASLEPPDVATVPPGTACIEGFIYRPNPVCEAWDPRVSAHVRTGRKFTNIRIGPRGFYRVCGLAPGAHQLVISGHGRTIELEANKTQRIDHRVGGKIRWRTKVEITDAIGENPKKGETIEFLATFEVKTGDTLTARGHRYLGAWRVRKCQWPLGHYDPPAFTREQMGLGGRRGGKGGCCGTSGSPSPSALLLVGMCLVALRRRR